MTSASGEQNGENQGSDYALKLCEIGVDQLLDGQVKLAIETFEESLKMEPTAEGYTYRGWASSLLGNLNEAISYCMKAIRVDAQFGNPYNDIGVYLMQLGRLEEALSWLEKAKRAIRYGPRHFPYLNTGHVYMLLGEQNKALHEYVNALDLDPENAIAKKAISKMEMDFF